MHSFLYKVVLTVDPVDEIIKCDHYATQYNTIQYNTIQYNTIQYNTIQFNTIQHEKIDDTLRHDAI